MFTAWSSETKLQVATLRPDWHCWRFSRGSLSAPFQWRQTLDQWRQALDQELPLGTQRPVPLVRREHRLLEAERVECWVYRGKTVCWPSAHRPAERALSFVPVEPNPAAVPGYSEGVPGHVVAIDAIALCGENGSAMGCRIPDEMKASYLHKLSRLTCYLNVAEVCFGIEPDDPSHAGCVHDIFEFPEGVADKVLACDGFSGRRKNGC